MTHGELIRKIIKIRKGLIKRKKSLLPDGKCIHIIGRLNRHIDAYGDKWSADQWKTFIKNNYYDILYIIPSNNSRKHYEELLNSLML